jgi:hypothetical protein
MIFGLFGGNKPAESPEQLGYEPNEATQYLMDYLQNGSKFSSSNEAFRDNLNSTLGTERGVNVVGAAFAPQMSRYGSEEEINSLYNAARLAGAADNPNELRNFTSQYLAMTPAGQAQDMSPYYNNQSYLGATARDAKGEYVGQRVFGNNEEMYTKAKDLIGTSTDLAQNYIAKLGAKGGFS